MWNNQEDRYADDYKSWAGITNDPENKHIPTFTENLRYFIRYQLNHMYWRYFFWNFVGRQNDNQGMYADLLNGNWISGIGFIDEMRLGPQNIPASLENKSRNTFFFLPLIFGLIGLYYHFKRNYKDGFVVALLFIMTGLAITDLPEPAFPAAKGKGLRLCRVILCFHNMDRAQRPVGL